MSKVQKPRLGRGLSSLMTVSELPVEVEVPDVRAPAVSVQNRPVGPPDPKEPEIRLELSGGGQPLEIPLASIEPNPHQPRRDIDEAKVAELAASLRSTGLIQPVIVRKQGDVYQLIAGERRWRAAKVAGLATIPAIVRDVSTFEQAQMALVENIQREDLNPIERARSYRTLIDQLGLTQAELASRLGEDRSGIANYLRLLDLGESVREMVQAGLISLGHAKILAGVEDPLEQERLANLVRTQDLSVRNLERTIAEARTGSATSAGRSPGPTEPSAHVKDLERTLARQLGMRVQLRPSARKGQGKLILHYASLDQFDTLLSRLGLEAE